MSRMSEGQVMSLTYPSQAQHVTRAGLLSLQGLSLWECYRGTSLVRNTHPPRITRGVIRWVSEFEVRG